MIDNIAREHPEGHRLRHAVLRDGRLPGDRPQAAPAPRQLPSAQAATRKALFLRSKAQTGTRAWRSPKPKRTGAEISRQQKRQPVSARPSARDPGTRGFRSTRAACLAASLLSEELTTLPVASAEVATGHRGQAESVRGEIGSGSTTRAARHVPPNRSGTSSRARSRRASSRTRSWSSAPSAPPCRTSIRLDRRPDARRGGPGQRDRDGAWGLPLRRSALADIALIVLLGLSRAAGQPALPPGRHDVLTSSLAAVFTSARSSPSTPGWSSRSSTRWAR